MPAESVRLKWKSTGQAHLQMFGFSALVLNDEIDSLRFNFKVKLIFTSLIINEF